MDSCLSSWYENMPLPSQQYQQAIDIGKLIADDDQIELLRVLDMHANQVNTLIRASTISRFWHRKGKYHPGLYLHGQPGGGKSIMLNMLYQSINTNKKQWLHFHAFMTWLHNQLDDHKGMSDPLIHIATLYAKTTKVLFFDEFYISDIANAMLLGYILKAFTHRGIYIVCSSNIAIENLYQYGLQRSRFLPTIAWMQKHFQSYHLQAHNDYRQLLCPSKKLTYYINQNLNFLLHAMSLTRHDDAKIEIANQFWPCMGYDNNAICLDSQILLYRPHTTQDFWQLAGRYRCIGIHNLKALDDTQKNAVWRLIHFIDVCYELQCSLQITASCTIDKLYTGVALGHRFNRTISRLNRLCQTD